MKKAIFALLLVSFAILGLGAPVAQAQILSMGDLQFGPSVGGGFGFTHNQDAKNVCPGLKATEIQFEEQQFLTCSSSANVFKGYLSGTLDFTSKNRWPGLGMGVVFGQEWNRSFNTRTTFRGEVENLAIGLRQFGVGLNFYLPIPATMHRLVLVPSVQQVFWTQRLNYTDTFSDEVEREHLVATGKAVQYGGSLRYRVANHIFVEGGVSYENIPPLFNFLSSMSAGSSQNEASTNYWDFAFGLRYVLWDTK